MICLVSFCKRFRVIIVSLLTVNEDHFSIFHKEKWSVMTVAAPPPWTDCAQRARVNALSGSLRQPVSSLHVRVMTVCQENSHTTPLWTGVESAGQSDISAWESCSLDISALKWTPSLGLQVWVESGGLQRERERERGGGEAVKDEKAWGRYPCVSGGFPGRTSLCVEL